MGALNWWLGDKGEHRHQEKHTWSLDSVKGELAAAKKGLDARMCNTFMLYLKLEIGIKDEEWMSLVSQTQVTALYFLNINHS